ncbi:MAG TPA: hypothetical protein VGV17_23990 [Bosea sp. (in: a-proteobacteria)]|jgi:hypothetical protein|uniref:hypothetical protein n=1 Tax=Bosea sp. (in: a-proteobacteria) TaxID=1871050 RepID=UPI002DDDB8B6|nr:hypothetical protein [Bosea sp. (in: a-proteobacteria)]HEV2556824.1 hypothetical protein [Bosea sp. (in: a-proteobacteria)]
MLDLATRHGKPLAVLFAGLALLALAAFGFWRGMAAIDALEARAAAAAKAERDAHWRAEIAASNAAVAEAKAAQAVAAMTAEAAIRAAEAQFQTELNELETRNAALPDGDRRGLGRDRVRLLNGAR